MTRPWWCRARYPPGRRLCSSIAIKPYRLVSYWCVCAPTACACPPAPCPPRPCPHPAGGARSPCGDERLENSHLVPLPYRRGRAASSGGPRAPGDRHNPPPGPLSSSSSLDNIFRAGAMRGCGSRLVWLLVLSLAWLGPALGGEDEDEEVIEEQEKEKKEDEVLSDEIKEEDNVLVLHEHNFARALSEHQLLLVEFCECPQCGQGQMRGRECWQGGLAVAECEHTFTDTGTGGVGRGTGCGTEGQEHRPCDRA